MAGDSHISRNDPSCPVLTTANGAPIGVQQALTAGPRGPVLMQDVALLEQMQHFNRERIPERVVHAKGSGAYGTFTVTVRRARTRPSPEHSGHGSLRSVP